MNNVLYASVLCLSYQSHRYTLSMTTHVSNMAADMVQSERLEAEATVHHDLALEHANKAEADQLEATTLQQHVAELEADMEREELIVETNLVKEDEFHAKAVEEQAEADTLAVQVATTEDMVLDLTEKSASEAAAAAKDMVETTEDTAGTLLCEFVPLVDVVCDVVGTVAAFGLQSQAAKLTAQSALDAAAAASAQLEEDQLALKVELLEEESTKDEIMAEKFAADAKRGKAFVVQEQAEAEREQLEAQVLYDSSEKEQILAEEEAWKAEAKDVEAAHKTSDAMSHGLRAFVHALLAGTLAVTAVVFFVVRTLLVIIIPGARTIGGFLSTKSIQEQDTIISRNSTSHTSTRTAGVTTTIPKNGILYFAGHCCVFFISMVILGPQLLLMDHLHIRNQGGVVLMFAAMAAFVQSVLFHVCPVLVSILRHQADDHSLRPNTGGHILSNLVLILGQALLYLVPLFVMELCEWRLLSNHFFFATDISRLGIAILCGTLLTLAVMIALTPVVLDDKEQDYTATHRRAKEHDMEVAMISETSRLLLVQQHKDEHTVYGEYEKEEVSNNAQARNAQTPTMSAAVEEPTTVQGLVVVVVQQYITDLLLPFEILIATCMVIKLSECSPVISQLWPRIIDAIRERHYPHWMAQCSGVGAIVLMVLFLLVGLAYSQSWAATDETRGHVGIWVGRVGPRRMGECR